ncbi:MAG: hypothetical protein VW711_00180, partial [Verrucomicrobiales bacterium]
RQPFRGSYGDGMMESNHLSLTRWITENLLWLKKLASIGGSSRVIAASKNLDDLSDLLRFKGSQEL